MTDNEILLRTLSENFTKIIHVNDLKETPLYWGGNGVGDRFANKKFNYSVVYNKGKYKTYSENTTDKINDEALLNFQELYPIPLKNVGIMGIFIHSKRNNIQKRPISKEIDKIIKLRSCVVCGSSSEIITDHKNDLYNDERVLNVKTQILEDFQCLCNHCNLQKRQVCKKEFETQKIYSVKNISQFKYYTFEIPWEKKNYDINDITTKVDTYWYDPEEFNRKLMIYTSYVYPIVLSIKSRNIKLL